LKNLKFLTKAVILSISYQRWSIKITIKTIFDFGWTYVLIGAILFAVYLLLARSNDDGDDVEMAKYIVVNTLGVKEIWYSFDVPNLGYDYDDGSRIACYELTEIQ
jgi:hypothetical protein